MEGAFVRAILDGAQINPWGEGHPLPAITTMAERMGRSARQVRAAIKSLECGLRAPDFVQHDRNQA